MEPTPNHHDDASSKRRRLDQAPTPESVNVQRYVATLTSSPQRQSPNLSPHDDANSEDGQTQNDLPFTQDPALLRPTDVALSSPERSTDLPSHYVQLAWFVTPIPSIPVAILALNCFDDHVEPFYASYPKCPYKLWSTI